MERIVGPRIQSLNYKNKYCFYIWSTALHVRCVKPIASGPFVWFFSCDRENEQQQKNTVEERQIAPQKCSIGRFKWCGLAIRLLAAALNEFLYIFRVVRETNEPKSVISFVNNQSSQERQSEISREKTTNQTRKEATCVFDEKIEFPSRKSTEQEIKWHSLEIQWKSKDEKEHTFSDEIIKQQRNDLVKYG